MSDLPRLDVLPIDAPTIETQPGQQELLRVALAVARDAAALVLGGFRQHKAVELKGRRDLVTEFDVASERRIRTRLAHLTPAIPVLGEELGDDGGAAADDAELVRWAVDPIDGTTNYAHGHPIWGVSVGLVKGKEPVLGAIVAPALGWDWSGYVGAPGFPGVALRNGEPCAVSETSDPEDALVATGFPAERTQAPTNNFDSFTRVKQLVRAVRRCGACCIDMAFVADGTYDAYWERPLHIWDSAAGAAILLAAGGRVSSIDGTPADLTRGHLLASNGRVHDALVGPIMGPSA